MVKTLDSIKQPIAEELRDFEKHFRELMRSKVPLLDRITYYIVKRKGKQVRPMFVFLCAKLCGDDTEKVSFIGASLVEIMHTASLVHDDVVDDSYERRGFFSINALWKNKIAVFP
jgi:octaprenyl-diphosphate synthase